MKEVYVIGIGMGNPDTITTAGRKAISDSQVMIGAARMVDSLRERKNQQAVYAILPQEILRSIQENRGADKLAILMSGDLGFFSGAKKLRSLIAETYGSDKGNENINFRYLPGISSLSYLSCAIGISWEDAKIVSLHGREGGDSAYVMNSEKTFFLTDGKNNTVKNICKRLTAAGLGDTKVFVGERLSYDDEKITEGRADELEKQEFEPLSVMLVLNEKPLIHKKDTIGINDDEFIRTSVPMTKEEVRTITVSKLDLNSEDIVYDIGAGTGSVSIELALACRYGSVYAVETNKDAVSLIEKNKESFHVKNLHIIEGKAPEALQDLPVPQKAFIGGSKGNLEEIIRTLIKKNPNIRIVINVVALESLAEAVRCVKYFNFKYVDIVQMNIAKAKTLGSYNLMMGQNPVYVITVQHCGEE